MIIIFHIREGGGGGLFQYAIAFTSKYHMYTEFKLKQITTYLHDFFDLICGRTLCMATAAAKRGAVGSYICDGG